MNVGTLIERAGRRYGGRVALEDHRGELTFEQVADRVNRLARGLLGLGLEPGDRVLDLQTNSTDYVVTDYALASAGLVRVALNHRHQPQDWGRIAHDNGARGIIFADRFRHAAAGVLDEVAVRVCVDADGDDRSAGIELIENTSAGPLGVDVGPDDLVSLNYSSGTTGRPKGALRSHRNRMASLANIVTDILGGVPAPDDAWCHAGPLTHASGLFSLPHFALGARQVILPEWDPSAFVDAVLRRGVTGSVLVPTMLVRLMRSDALPAGGLTSLRRLVYAGAPMPPEQVREALRDVTPRLIQMYGLVEAIPPVTVLDEAAHREGATSPDSMLLASAGRPCLGVELRIVDEAGHEVAPGEVGEVITRGDHTMAGYWGTADDAVAKSIVDGWLLTGDLGKLVDDHLYLVDRKGDMIISGGYNIYPREVEDVIAEVDGVDQVVVLGAPDPEWGQRIVAFVTSARGATIDVGAIERHCRERLAGYKKPKEIHQVDELPVGVTGKVSKQALVQLLTAADP